MDWLFFYLWVVFLALSFFQGKKRDELRSQRDQLLHLCRQYRRLVGKIVSEDSDEQEWLREQLDNLAKEIKND